MAEKAPSREDFMVREVASIACLLPMCSAYFTFGGAHPLVSAFSDPASDRIGPWIGVVVVGLFFWIGTLAFWVWAIRWYVRRRKRRHGGTAGVSIDCSNG